MTALVTTAALRDYLDLNASPSDSKYSEATLGSNLRAAAWALARATGRTFADTTATRKFTTNGAPYLAIPGLRVATSVTLQGSALEADASYWLIPDSQQTGIYTGIQLRAFQNGRSDGPAYLANPQWFDRGLDLPGGAYGSGSSLPNDLVIAGSWGYATYTDVPEPYLHAEKVLAAYYTKRPDALLSGSLTTPDGNFVNLSTFPIEVRAFIEEWRVSPQVTGL